MTFRILLPTLALALNLGFSPVASAKSQDFVGQQKLTSHLIVNMFLQHLDNSDLSLLGQSINSDNLLPQRVSFNYQIQNDKLNVDIYNVLVSPLPVPEQADLFISGITVTVDDNGVIEDVKAHVSNQ